MKVYGTRRLFGRPEPVFAFDQDLATFAPGMAKRAGTVFAGAPIVQGKWDGSGTPDVLSAAVGDAITPVGFWHQLFDPYQGGGVVTWTPEQSSGDQATHATIWHDGANDYNLYYDYADNKYKMEIGTQSMSTGAIPVTAGTEEYLAWGFDTNNTLDGTNYAFISRNDSQTFSITTQPTVSAINGIYPGNWWGVLYPANGILEGLTFVREVPWTGAYGTDMGQGDIVAAHYNGGAGADVCLSIGSWGVTFCLPTNATPEELVTGTGEAWSHPHSSAVNEHSWLEDGGYLGRPYGVLYNATTTSAVVTDGVVIQDLQDDAFTAEAWIRADGYGENNTGRIFEKASGWGASGWVFTLGTNGIQILIDCATTNAYALLPSNAFVPDGKWHHVCFFFDDAGDRKPYIAIDGVWAATYATQTAGVGAIDTDVGQDLYIGNASDNARTFDGAIGWCRISDNDRYAHTTDFVPARQAPASDGNTVVLYHLDEGAGATLDNETGAAAYDATLSNHVWEAQWDMEGSPVVPYSVEFNATTTSAVVSDGVVIQDLHDAAMTVEGWFRADSTGEGTYGTLFTKSSPGTAGWDCTLHPTQGIEAQIFCVDTNARSRCGSDEFTADGKWHHVCLFFDDAGDRKIYLAIDGIWVNSYSLQVAGVGAIVSDVGLDLYIGNRALNDLTFDGGIGWVRISDNDRHNGTNEKAFVPPSRLNAPATDGNTVVQYNFREGAGATLDNATGAAAYDATLSNYDWNITPDMHVDCPGQKLYGLWGYVLGCDAANEGFTQIDTGRSSGEDFVMRIPLQYERDRQFWPRIQAYDEIGAAAIVDFYGPRLVDVHTGANNSATLINANGHFPQSLVGGALYNVTDGSSTTITAISGDGTTCTGVLAGGTDNDWDTNDIYMLIPPNEDSWVWCEPFCVELPAGCTSASWKVMNANTEGAMYAHQVETQASRVTNGGLEAGAGNPWIPTGWVNSTFGAGEATQDVVDFHSGLSSIDINAGVTRIMYDNFSQSSNQFYGIGFWSLWVSGNPQVGDLYNRVRFQTSATVNLLISGTGTGWTHHTGVGRAISPGGRLCILTNGASQASLDDLYYISLDNVSLTATPASEANSAETSGLRVDGADGLTQPTAAGATSRFHGHYRADYVPRHDLADVGDWGNASGYLMMHEEDANNYIFARAEVGGLRLGFNAQGAGLQQGFWAGAWLRTVPHRIDVVRSPTRAVLYMDGAPILTVAAACVFAADFTAAVNWCSTPLPWNEYDGNIA